MPTGTCEHPMAMDHFKSFAWYLSGDYVLSGQLDSRHNICEWEWMRVHAALGLQSRDFRFLQTNKCFKKSSKKLVPLEAKQLAFISVPAKGVAAWLDAGLHPLPMFRFLWSSCITEERTVQTLADWGILWKALASVLCLLPSRRQVPASCKSKCLVLLGLLLQQAVSGQARSQVQPEPLTACIHDTCHTPHYAQLSFDENGMTSSLAALRNMSDRCVAEWKKFTSAQWCSRKVGSSLELMSLWDLVTFCSWAKALQNAAWFVKDLYPKIISYMGELLDGHCVYLAAGGLRRLPVLRNKEGHVRRMPRVNKLVGQMQGPNQTQTRGAWHTQGCIEQKP